MYFVKLLKTCLLNQANRIFQQACRRKEEVAKGDKILPNIFRRHTLHLWVLEQADLHYLSPCKMKHCRIKFDIIIRDDFAMYSNLYLSMSFNVHRLVHVVVPRLLWVRENKLHKSKECVI